MFENIKFDDDQKSGVDVLNSLLNSDDIELKSDVDLSQIQVLCQMMYFRLAKAKEIVKENIYVNGKLVTKEKQVDKYTPEEVESQIIDYYLKLKCSIKRGREKAVVESLKYMRDGMFENQMIPALSQRDRK